MPENESALHLDDWSPLGMATKRHQYALATELLRHPAIWGDFQLRTNSWRRLIDAALALARPLTIVETGTARDNGSTWLLHRLLRETGGVLHSVDINPVTCGFAWEVIARVDAAEEVKVHCADAVSFLEQFPGTIDVLYLDSLDIDWSLPFPSMQQHLREMRAAFPKLAETSLVAFDDTPRTVEFAPWWIMPATREFLRAERVPGKGTLAIEWLLDADTAKIETLSHEYQAVFAISKR